MRPEPHGINFLAPLVADPRLDQILCKYAAFQEEFVVLLQIAERFIKAALPRIRDFRGVSPRCFDKNGNYTIGISDQSIFPEVELDKIKRNIGFDVTIVTTARTDEEAKSLLSEMGMPFSDRAKKPAAQAA